jgi:hypothetical protein
MMVKATVGYNSTVTSTVNKMKQLSNMIMSETASFAVCPAYELQTLLFFQDFFSNALSWIIMYLLARL